MAEIKTQFPIFKNQKNLVYLDNAATTQTPQVVLNATDEYYKKYRSNVHRGFYEISQKATDAYEAARSNIAKFINADVKEIIFNSGTTFGLNQLAYSLAPRLSHRDNVVLTRWEHHSNLVPWQQMAKHYGFEIRFIDLSPALSLKGERGDRRYSSDGASRSFTAPPFKEGAGGGHAHILASATKLIDANTKIVSFGLVSNVLGTIAPAKEIIKLAKKVKAITIVDAAQAMAHIPVDVKDLDCDFLCFSGHKMYGPTGIGVLYGKKIMLEEHLEPFLFGGEMVTAVSYDKSEWNEVPHKFEAGTPNIAGAIGLGAAVKFINKIGFKAIATHEKLIINQLINQLTAVGAQIVERHDLSPALSLKGERGDHRYSSDGASRSFTAPPFKEGAGGGQIGVVSFTIPGIHPHDIAEVLAKENICIRAGFHCAEPLHRHLGLNQGTVRASLGIYNTKEDIERLIAGIKKVRTIFKS